uniref:Uncharacterized protein n=1 Tax=Arundo donax TaxID=35708 RepID=A0A0A9B974_ARUDO
MERLFILYGKCKIKSIFSGRHLRSRLFCFKIRVKERMNSRILLWIAPPMFTQILK